MPLGVVLKILAGAEQPFATIVDGHAPGEPPSPSPSITRRRTPAALAVGVHPFKGTRSGPHHTFLGSARLTHLRLLHFRDGYYARSGLRDHLNSDGFDYWSDRRFHFPCDFLHWRGFRLRPGNRSLRRFRSLGCRTRLTALSCALQFSSLLYF
jgi:hypothetical protein